MVCNSVQLVNDFGVLCSASGKFKSLFKKIASSDNEGPVHNIKPLCPTRWLVRIPAIQATLQQYGLILDTLKETRSVCSNEVSARASGLYNRFQDGATMMCLIMAQSHRTTRVLKQSIAVDNSHRSRNAGINNASKGTFSESAYGKIF